LSVDSVLIFFQKQAKAQGKLGSGFDAGADIGHCGKDGWSIDVLWEDIQAGFG